MYNVIQHGKAIFTGTRFECETFIEQRKLTVALVDEANFALIVH